MEVICYACGRGEFPENTIQAIDHCQNVNKDWRIEVDLQMTKDGEIILFHDDNLKRITDLNINVSEVSLQFVKELNAGHNFRLGKNYPFGEKAISIPLLSEAFDTFPKANFLLDIHTKNLEAASKVIKIVENKKMENQVVVASKYNEIIHQFKDKRKKWTYGASAKEAKSLIFSSFLLLDPFFPLQSDILMIPVTYGNIRFLTPRVLSHLRKHKKKIWVWLHEGKEVTTINSQNQFSKLENMGVDGIFTEYPKKLLREFEKFKKLNSLY